MQFVVDRNHLLKALSAVAGVPSARAELPILSCLLLTVGKDGGRVRGTDMDVDITAAFEVASCPEAGRIAIHAKFLHDLVKRMPEGAMISVTDLQKGNATYLRLVCGKSKVELATQSADDYPDAIVTIAKMPKGHHSFQIDARQLRAMFAGVKHAVSRDETRHYLGGVYLHATDGDQPQLRAVATTGKVLALQACAAPTGAYGLKSGVIIPRDTVAEILKHVPDGELLVDLKISTHAMWLECPGGLVIGSKLLEGTYPDYGRVLPSDHDGVITCEADQLAVIMDRVSSICEKGANMVAIGVNKKSELVLTASNPSCGEAVDGLESVTFAGKRVTLGVNPDFFASAIKVYAGGTIEVAYGHADAPILVKLAGDTSETSLQVVMPMRHNKDVDLLELKAA